MYFLTIFTTCTNKLYICTFFPLHDLFTSNCCTSWWGITNIFKAYMQCFGYILKANEYKCISYILKNCLLPPLCPISHLLDYMVSCTLNCHSHLSEESNIPVVFLRLCVMHLETESGSLTWSFPCALHSAERDSYITQVLGWPCAHNVPFTSQPL